MHPPTRKYGSAWAWNFLCSPMFTLSPGKADFLPAWSFNGVHFRPETHFRQAFFPCHGLISQMSNLLILLVYSRARESPRAVPLVLTVWQCLLQRNTVAEPGEGGEGSLSACTKKSTASFSILAGILSAPSHCFDTHKHNHLQPTSAPPFGIPCRWTWLKSGGQL